MQQINVLGTDYTIRRVDKGTDSFMEKMNYGGYCEMLKKEIVVLNMKTCPDWENEPEEVCKAKEKEILRHELIHAFLRESGLDWDSFTFDRAWARNEEMIDWLALQWPKLQKAFQEAGCI